MMKTIIAALNLIETDKDGDGFICKEAMEQVKEALLLAEKYEQTVEMFNYSKLKALAEAATPDPWETHWYVCTADAEDVKAGTAKKIGEELWRVPKSLGPLSPDHNHWAGTYIDCKKEDAEFIQAANPRVILKMIQELELYHWLRNQHWSDGTLIVTNLSSMKLDHLTYPGDLLNNEIRKYLNETNQSSPSV